MAIVTELLALGLPTSLGRAIGQSLTAQVVCQGNSQATAARIMAPTTVLAGGATAAAILPQAVGQAMTLIINASGNAQNLYPAVGDSLNLLAPNSPYSVANGRTLLCVPVEVGWHILDTAPSAGAPPVSYVQPTSDLVTGPSTPTATLPIAGGNIYVNNTGSTLALFPPASPPEGLLYKIIDFAGTANTYPISWWSSSNIIGDPTLIRVANGSCEIQYHNGQWVRIR
jgi:hypothetical protein